PYGVGCTRSEADEIVTETWVVSNGLVYCRRRRVARAAQVDRICGGRRITLGGAGIMGEAAVGPAAVVGVDGSTVDDRTRIISVKHLAAAAPDDYAGPDGQCP